MSGPRPGDGPVPLRGDVWRHYKGGHYVVLCVAVDANNLSRGEDRHSPVCGKSRYVVVYRVLGGTQVYVRAEAEFLEQVPVETVDCVGALVPRFTLDYRREGVGDQARTLVQT